MATADIFFHAQENRGTLAYQAAKFHDVSGMFGQHGMLIRMQQTLIRGKITPAGLQAIPHDLCRNRTAHTQQAADEHRDKIGPKQSASPAVGGSKRNLNVPRGRQRRDIVIRTAVTLPVTVNPNHRHDGRGKENKR